MSEKYNQVLKDTEPIRERYTEKKLTGDPKVVLEYYTELIKLANEGKLTRHEAAFLIANTMWYKSVDTNPGIESISLDAGELELPERFEGDELEYRWQRLNTWIEEEKEKYE